MTYQNLTLNDDPYLNDITLTGYIDGKQYTYDIKRAILKYDSDATYADIDPYSSYQIMTSRRASFTLELANPEWKLITKDIKKVSIKHEMTMEVIGEVTTENITQFTSQLPADASWTVKTDATGYGKARSIFVATWSVDPTSPTPSTVECDEERFGCSCCHIDVDV